MTIQRGPGRPRGNLPVKLCIKVSEKTRQYLSTLESGTISEVIDKLISASKAYKTWHSERFPEK